MNVNDEYITEIDKLAAQGAGIARIDGFVVFVKNSCPFDKVKIKITKVNKSYAQADIIELISPSKYRTSPVCPMQKICGACQIQYIDYDYQLKIKREITQDALKNIGGINIEVNNTIASPKIVNYRCKIQYPVSETKNSKRMLAGYYKPLSHEIINIKYCPIQPTAADSIIEFIRLTACKYDISGFCEKTHTGDLRHIVMRISEYTGDILLTLVFNSDVVPKRAVEFAKSVYDKFDKVCGVCINLNNKKTNVILGNDTVCVCGKDFISEKIIDKIFKISSSTFFQVNPSSAENIFRYVKDYIEKNFKSPVVLDAYAGISSFGICVSDVCSKVVSVEENSKSCQLAKVTAEDNGVENLEIFNLDAVEFIKQNSHKYDCVILDPPRKGCSFEFVDCLFDCVSDTVIYVSCNPATLARDLKYLVSKGAKILSVQPFDMFPHTFHVENVVIIKMPV